MGLKETWDFDWGSMAPFKDGRLYIERTFYYIIYSFSLAWSAAYTRIFPGTRAFWFIISLVTTLESSDTSASKDSLEQVSYINIEKWALTAWDFPLLLSSRTLPSFPYLLYVSHIFPEKLEHMLLNLVPSRVLVFARIPSYPNPHLPLFHLTCISKADLTLSPALETFPNPFPMPITQPSLPEVVFLFYNLITHSFTYMLCLLLIY